MTRRHQRLRFIAQRTRPYVADDETCLALESTGLIRRLGQPRPARLMSHTVVDWAITEAGQTLVRLWDEAEAQAHGSRWSLGPSRITPAERHP